MSNLEKDKLPTEIEPKNAYLKGQHLYLPRTFWQKLLPTISLCVGLALLLFFYALSVNENKLLGQDF